LHLINLAVGLRFAYGGIFHFSCENSGSKALVFVPDVHAPL
jgi:hypothetical protein